MRLNLHSRVMLTLIESAAKNFDAIKAREIPAPYREADPKLAIDRFEYAGARLEVPRDDDDVPTRPWFVKLLLQMNNRLSIFVDSDGMWASADEGKRVVEETFGHLIPDPQVVWNDPASDRSLEHWAFQGLVAQRMEAVEPGEALENGGFAVRFGFMEDLKVRRGFANYGADAFFTPKGKISHIRRGDRDIRPGEGEDWEVAKFAFRSSGLAWVTAADHLFHCHYAVSNALVLATKRHLSLEHPLRGFLAPFHFRTAAINNGSTLSLLPRGALLNRTLGFDWQTLEGTYAKAFEEYRYQPLPQLLEGRGMHPDQLADPGIYPYGEDAIPFWRIVRTFVDESSDQSPLMRTMMTSRRDETRRWWDEMHRNTPGGLPAFDEDALRDLLTHLIFYVSGFHNHVGNVAPYVCDPSFTAGKIRPGATMADKQTTAQVCVVASITGLPMPQLAGDFSHLMPDDETRECSIRLDERLEELREDIDARNLHRDKPFFSFSPGKMACSVSI